MNKLPVTCAAVLTLLGLLSACGESQAPVANAPKPAADAASANVATEPHPLPNVAYAAADLTGIEKAENGQTIAELYTDKAKWSGKPIAVRGKVVKSNDNIMDRTWVHVRDGTGEDGRNDLTITTKGPAPATGSTVLVTGTLTTDKDLGAGYKYEVIVEDGTITPQ